MLTHLIARWLVPDSLASGFATVAVASIAIALAAAQVKIDGVRYTSVVVLPVVFSYSLYWYPVWNGAHSAEYSAWEWLFVVPWSACGVFTACATLVLIEWFRFRFRKRVGSGHQPPPN
jgi:hypothetical protein